MSNQSIELVIKRIAQEDKATKALIQALENKVGPLAYLPTTAKDSIVLALIEIHGVLAGKLTASDIASAFGTTRDEILGGAAASVDTLKELADLWAGQDDSMGDLVNDLSGVLSYTEAQSLSAEQKALVIQSIGAISANAFNILTGRVTEIEGDLSDLDTAATNRANALISLIEAKSLLSSQQHEVLRVNFDMNNTDAKKQRGQSNLGIAPQADLQALSETVQNNVVDNRDYLGTFLSVLNSSATTTYQSAEISRPGSFNRSNCGAATSVGAGLTPPSGGPATIILAAGAYTSVISQADADAQAEAAASAMDTQVYADEYGTCSIDPGLSATNLYYTAGKIMGDHVATSMVTTGPNGYVFSQVYRKRTLGQNRFIASGITRPGIYSIELRGYAWEQNVVVTFEVTAV